MNIFPFLFFFFLFFLVVGSCGQLYRWFVHICHFFMYYMAITRYFFFFVYFGCPCLSLDSLLFDVLIYRCFSEAN